MCPPSPRMVPAHALEGEAGGRQKDAGRKADAPGPQAVGLEIGHIVRETTMCDLAQQARAAAAEPEEGGASEDEEPRASKVECWTRASSQYSRVSSAHTVRRAGSAESEPLEAEPLEAEPLHAEACSVAITSTCEPAGPPRLPGFPPCHLEARGRFNRFMSCALFDEYGAEVMGFPDASLSMNCADLPPHAHEGSCSHCTGECWSGPIPVFTSQRRHRGDGHTDNV